MTNKRQRRASPGDARAKLTLINPIANNEVVAPDCKSRSGALFTIPR